MMSDLERQLLKQKAVNEVAGEQNLHLIHLLMMDSSRADRTAKYMTEAGALAYYRGYFRYKLKEMQE